MFQAKIFLNNTLYCYSPLYDNKDELALDSQVLVHQLVNDGVGEEKDFSIEIETK